MLSFPSSPTTGQEHTTGGKTWVWDGARWAPKKETLDFAEAIHAAPAKPSPADADELGYVDSAASWGLKKLTWANLKAALASLFVSKFGDTIQGDLYVEKESGVEVDLGIRGFGVGPVLHGYLANGSKNTPTAVNAGQLIFGLGSRPYYGAGWTPHSTAAIHMTATENHSATAQGTDFRILVTPKGKTEADRKVALTIESTGQNTVTLFKARFSGPLAERAYFQSDVVDTGTSVGILSPVGLPSALNVMGASDPANSPYLQIWAHEISNETAIRSGASGTASALPLSVYVGSVKRLTVGTDGSVLALTGPLGYGPGAGGTVTQETSKSTAVTLNKPCGRITMHNAALAAGATVAFNFNNSFITPTDYLLVQGVQSHDWANYQMWASVSPAGGIAAVYVRNISAASRSEPLVINFAVIKGATS